MTDHYIEDETTQVVLDAEVEGKTGVLDFTTLKSGGIIKQRQKDKFTVRLRCPGGRVPVSKLKHIADAAEKYGGDYLHVTFRQSLEIPYVDYRDFGKMKSELNESGIEIASCGPRVRVPTACSGCEYNPNGLGDTQGMTKLVNERFFGRPLPHKFKISFSGCPIDCARTNEMDLGFQGAVKPTWRQDLCIRCGICATACLEGAIESHPETNEPIYHSKKCLYCGDCIRTCPADAWLTEVSGWIVRCGGKHGRHPVSGSRVAQFVTDSDVPQIIEAVTDWYAKTGKGRGRIRISTILMEPENWRDFLGVMREVAGGKAITDARPPVSNEIHF